MTDDLSPRDELLASLRQRHAALAERSLGGVGGGGDVLPRDRAGLIEDLVRAGAAIPNGADRDALRNMLFYWTSDQASRGERDRAAPAPVLLPFVAGIDVGASAAAPASPAAPLPSAQSAPPSVGVEAAQARPTAPSIGATLPLAALQVMSAFSRLAARFTARPPSPSVEATAVQSPDALPSAAEARRIVRISAMAREWRLTPPDRKRGYLINDAVTLAEAARYTGKDPEIAALVEASRAELEAAETRRRFRLVIGLLVAALLASLAIATLIWLNAEQRRAVTEKESETKDKLYAEAAADRNQARIDAEAAVQALQHGDLAPLRAMLQRLAYADPAELNRLQLRADASDIPPAPAIPQVRPSETTTRGTSEPSVAAAPPVSAPRTDSLWCMGDLWLGTKDGASRLASGIDPRELKVGDVASLAGSGQLISPAGRVNPVGRGARTMAVLPAGVSFTLAGEVRLPDTDSPQLWANVFVPSRFCTRVFVQYAGSQDRVNAVLAGLRQRGLKVPPAERLPSAEGLAEVRYFWPEDQVAALETAQALAELNGGAALRTVSLAKFAKKPSPGTIEVWLDLGR